MMICRLVYSRNSDSQGGYALPSPAICNNAADLEAELSEARLGTCPHTYLEGGHGWEIVRYENDNAYEQPAILVIPKDPIIKILYRDGRERMTSVGCYDATVNDVKVILGKKPGSENLATERMNLMTLNGVFLDDSESLVSADCFNMEPLLYREQLSEYFTDSATDDIVIPSDRMASALSATRSLQREWCELNDLNNETEEVARFLQHKFEGAIEKSKTIFGKDKALSEYTYAPFIRDLPTESAPSLQDSPGLDALKTKLASLGRSRHSNSKRKSVNFNRLPHASSRSCPAQAKRTLRRTLHILKRTNVDIADEVANSLELLMKPIKYLSEKTPFLYPHHRFHSMLDTADKSLNRYKDIRAGKLLEKPHELIERQNEVEALLDVSRRAILSPAPLHARPHSAGDEQDQAVLR
jgi:hypothetical protein